MTNIRKNFLILKDGFLDAKFDSQLPVFELANSILIMIFAAFISCISLFILGKNYITYFILLIIMIVYMFFLFYKRAFLITLPLAISITGRLFGRYGRVITKKDWLNIKKYCPILYRRAFSKISYGKCYYYSRAIALFLTDVKLLYCSVITADGKKTGHSVIIKNNYIYDTNAKRHYYYDEYSKILELTVYKTFSHEEYSKKSFFDDIRADFEKWCSDNNARCYPQ